MKAKIITFLPIIPLFLADIRLAADTNLAQGEPKLIYKSKFEHT